MSELGSPISVLALSLVALVVLKAGTLMRDIPHHATPAGAVTAR